MKRERERERERELAFDGLATMITLVVASHVSCYCEEIDLEMLPNCIQTQLLRKCFFS